MSPTKLHALIAKFVQQTKQQEEENKRLCRKRESVFFLYNAKKVEKKVSKEMGPDNSSSSSSTETIDTLVVAREKPECTSSYGTMGKLGITWVFIVDEIFN